MDAYRKRNGQSLTPKQVEYAVHKFKRHRSMPDSIFNELLPLFGKKESHLQKLRGLTLNLEFSSKFNANTVNYSKVSVC